MPDITLLWWHWLAAGMAVLVADLMLVNSFYLLWLGLGMVPVAAALLAFPDLSPLAQAVTWTLSSLALIWVWRRFRRAEEPDDSVAGMVGMTCIVTSWDGGRGQVRLQRPFAGRDVWDAQAAAAVAKGDICRISAVDRAARRVTLAKD